MIPAPNTVIELVRRFSDNEAVYRTDNYREREICTEFIEPFFEALGWDVRNVGAYAEPYKDVVHEGRLAADGSNESPDYVFRIGGVKKFIVEAKRPYVNVRDYQAPAFQLRNYCWGSKLPIGILMSFAEFAVYDGRIPPHKTDPPRLGRIEYLTYNDYIPRWDELASRFSREAVLKGYFDQYAAEKRDKATAAEVDEYFLADIERWRQRLAESLAKLNPSLTLPDLNSAVQRTIDRIVFLRICEDRGIEPKGQLLECIDAREIYKSELIRLFRTADDKYNSGLFHFKKERNRAEDVDTLTLHLTFDDDALRSIIRKLYSPARYDFSIIPADILGHVYEQFLGKVIILDDKHRASVVDKPDVKKAGGVYYTPTYIVRTIVYKTLGAILKERTPKSVVPLRILDPACGSGSFLIEAYQRLLDWYLAAYVAESASKHKKKLVEVGYNTYRLITTEKKRILLEHIYGVDIDAQAVEVTKLSLLLKVLEGESEETLDATLRLFHERALPDLGNNVKCGNSLIGSDLYDVVPIEKFTIEDRRRLNVFDWTVEFPWINATGGFDVVLGNPPWGAVFSQTEKEYLKTAYSEVHVRTPESYNYFYAEMRKLTRDGGLTGLIIPSSFLSQYEYWKSRKKLVEDNRVSYIVNLGDGVFNKVTAPCCILISSNIEPDNTIPQVYCDFRASNRATLPAELLSSEGCNVIYDLGKNSEYFNLRYPRIPSINRRVEGLPRLSDVAEDVATGISSGLDSAYVYSKMESSLREFELDVVKKLAVGGEIDRYSLSPTSDTVVLYITPETDMSDHAHVEAALLPFKEKLLKRREAANGKIPWYSLNWPRRQKLFDKPKIMVRQTSDRIRAVYDDESWYCLKSVILIQLPEKSELSYYYLVGLLNSTLMHYFYDELVDEEDRVFAEVKPIQIFQLPIYVPKKDEPKDVICRERLVSLVKMVMDTHKELGNSHDATNREVIRRTITRLESEIDSLIFGLYECTPEEVRQLQVRYRANAGGNTAKISAN